MYCTGTTLFMQINGTQTNYFVLNKSGLMQEPKYFGNFQYSFNFVVVDSKSQSSRGCATTDSEMYDTGDDEILEACVRTAAAPSTRPNRERKRSSKHRKSCMYTPTQARTVLYIVKQRTSKKSLIEYGM